MTLLLGAALPAESVPALQRHVYAETAGREIGADMLRDGQPELIVDALIGYGLSALPRAITAELIAWANESAAPIVSLDVPSGVDATTGATPGIAIRPQWTMTLALPKTGLRPDNCGQLVLADIGIPAGTFRRAGLAYVSPFGDDLLIVTSGSQVRGNVKAEPDAETNRRFCERDDSCFEVGCNRRAGWRTDLCGEAPAAPAGTPSQEGRL